MSNDLSAQSAHKLQLLKLTFLQIAILTMTACGGGGYGGNNTPPRTPAPTIAEAQFVDETVEGLGFRVADVVEGKTDAAGKFRFAVGRPVQFFIGSGADRLVIGTATPAAAAPVQRLSACRISRRCRTMAISISATSSICSSRSTQTPT